MKPTIVIASFCAIISLAHVAIACPAPGTYTIDVTDNTVRVLTVRGCADTSLLRQRTDDDAVVGVHATCVDGWLVDSCVAPGEYRYGFALPLATPTSDCSCGPFEYFGTATISAPLPTTCVSSDAPSDGGVPWGTDPTICSPPACATAEPGAPCSADGGATNETMTAGCDVAVRTRSSWSNLLVVATALALLASRRRRSF